MDQVIHRMTNDERKTLGKDLGNCISQRRHIPNHSKYRIANTLGGPIYDHRFEEGYCGPFNLKADFIDFLTKDFEDCRHEPSVSALYEKHHEIYFTHSDLYRTNIYVQAGQLSGIVDWEHAGFKPEYWEYTRALRAHFAPRDQREIIDNCFHEDYKDELEAEMFLWRLDPTL